MPDLLPADTDTTTNDDLRQLTNAVVDRAQQLLRRCTDADVTFVPQDPLADDPHAEPEHEQTMAWTLGHIIVHMSASAEDFAAVAAEMARSVAYHGRSRHEVPWRSVTTLAQCRARLDESRRMCLASRGREPRLWVPSPVIWSACATPWPISIT